MIVAVNKLASFIPFRCLKVLPGGCGMGVASSSSTELQNLDELCLSQSSDTMSQAVGARLKQKTKIEKEKPSEILMNERKETSGATYGEQSQNSTKIDEWGPGLSIPLAEIIIQTRVRSFTWDTGSTDARIDSKLMWEWDNEEDLSYLVFIWGLRLMEKVLIDCEYDSPCRSHYENNSIYFGIDIIEDRILDDVSKVVPIIKTIYCYFKPAKRSVPSILRHKITTFMGGVHSGTNVVTYPPHRINIYGVDKL